MKKCPYCAEEIQEEAIVCRYCGKDVLSKPRGNNRFAIASFVLGIISLVAWFIPLCGFPISILALIFGFIGKRGLALAGIILALLGLMATTANSTLGAYLGFKGELYSPPAIRPTFTYLPTYTLYTSPTTWPTATRKPCINAFFINAADVGKTLCVYGRIYDIQFHAYNNTSRIVFSDLPGFFFVCVECYFPDIKKGDCVQGQGIVELSYDKLPFINLKRTLYSSSYCE